MTVRVVRRVAALALVSGCALAHMSGAVRATGSTPPPPSPPLQPSEKVYATSANNKILEIDFFAGTTTTIVSDPGSKFQGLAVLGNFHIAAADQNQGGKVKLFNLSGAGLTLTTAINFPSGVTADSDQNIFVTNSTSGGGYNAHTSTNSGGGGGGSANDEVWRLVRNYATCLEGSDPLACPNGGYTAAQKIDGPVEVDGVATKTLADAKAEGGRLWVLVEKPALLLRYDDPATCASPCPKTVAIDKDNFDGLTPTGLALTGEFVLVTTEEGKVLRFSLAAAADDDPFNDERLSDFVSNLGGKGERIAVGLRNALPQAFVTVHPKTVKQYAIEGGVGTLLAKVTKLNSPVGVGLGSASASVTGVGSPEVSLQSVEAHFENVGTAGLSDASCFSFKDVRESEPVNAGVALNKPLKTELVLTDPRLPANITGLGFPNKIPRYLRAFRKPGETEGTFRMCIAKTTAGFTGLIQVHGDKELQWLGFDPSCSASDKTMRPRFFLSEEPPIPALLEGRVFINHSSLCGSDGADAWNMNSLYLTGARDTRKADNTHVDVDDAELATGECKDDAGVVDCQLNRLRKLVHSSSCIPSADRSTFLHKLDKAIDSFDDKCYCDALEWLERFEARVEEAPASAFPAACPARLRAEIRGRTKAAHFGIETDLCH